MSTSYLCKKCNFRCINYIDIKRHINKKKICKKKNLESFSYSDDQLLILTLINYNNDIHTINMKEVDYLKESNKIYKNKEELFCILDEIDRNKMKKCKFCKEEFPKIIDLRKHVIINCFYNYLENIYKKNDENTTTTINSEGNNNNINHLNQCILNTTQNITNNIYLEIKPPVPFDGDWDISKLDENIRARLLISQIMYTTLLDEILKNDVNLNVIIDKDSKSGMVYKNDKEQYISMKLMDIIDESMEKLKKHLLEINNDASKSGEFKSDILRASKSYILSKYNDYNNYEGIKNYVNDSLSSIFEDKRDKALEKSKRKDINLKLPKNGF